MSEHQDTATGITVVVTDDGSGRRVYKLAGGTHDGYPVASMRTGNLCTHVALSQEFSVNGIPDPGSASNAGAAGMVRTGDRIALAVALGKACDRNGYVA